MRFFLSRIFKNFRFINNIWLNFLDKYDDYYFSKHCKNYKIVPFGNYCLPRVITTLNGFKPRKKYGEESFPFDLCFSDFSCNVKLLSDNFSNFFDGIFFDKDKNFWINNKTKMMFNHDHSDENAFKNRYENRIKNLYNAMHNTSIHIYFLVAAREPLYNNDVEQFINLVKKYRDDSTFDLIIINQSSKKENFNCKNVHCIDLHKDKSFEKIIKNGEWCIYLSKMKGINARIFNHKICSKLSKIIKK